MAHLNIWFILLLIGTAKWGGQRCVYGRRRWGGTALATGSSTNETSPVGLRGDGEVVNSICRDGVASGTDSTRMFELISPEEVKLDRFASPLHLDGTISQAVAIRTDVCPGNVTLCSDGFTMAIWLRPDDTSISNEGVYYISSGGQRAESCGFYFRLDSVTFNPTDGSRVGVFGIGVATSDTFWQVRYQAILSEESHVMMMWSFDLGLDVHVDGTCAGTQAADGGYQRDPVASCSDDPFTNLYIGRRNDLSGGYAVGDIGQLTIWDVWMNPSDVYNQTDEGVLRAYYENCVPWAAVSSSLQPSSDPSFSGDSNTSLPWQCRAACNMSWYKYAGIGGATPSCYCLTNYTYSESDHEGSCNVCTGYTEIKCGSPDSLSLYRLSSFQDMVSPSQEAVKGLSVSLDGVETANKKYTVTTQQNVDITFSISAGDNVFYIVYGDDRMEEIHTFETSTYLFFPEPGLYVLTVAATNEISQKEIKIKVTAELGSLRLELISDGLAATSEPVSITLVMINGGPGITCHLYFGDGMVDILIGVQSTTNHIHQYTNPGVYLVTALCSIAGSNSVNASTTVTIQDQITIILNTAFRVTKGANLTVPFQIFGTDITNVAVVYDGISSITNFTCSDSFACKGYIAGALTNSIGTHVFEVRAANLISGLVSSRADVYVGVPISNFSSEINATVVTPNEWVEVTAYITEGTHVYFHFDYNGNSTVFICQIAPCVISHSQEFLKAGVFQVSVEVSNDFNAFTSEVYTVKVYNPVPALSVDVINSSSTQDPVTLNIYTTKNTSLWPTEATVVSSIEGFANQFEESFTPSSEAVLTLFLIIPNYGTFVVNLNVSNAVNFVVLQVPIQIWKGITGFYCKLSPEIQATGENVSFEFGFSTGGPVVFNVDFGDGMWEEAANASTAKTINHIYINPGDYTVIVRAQNAFDEKMKELSLSIINPIDGLQVGTSSTNIATGVPVQFVFYIEMGAAIPQTVHCFVYYGDGSEVDLLEGSLSDVFNMTIEHTYVSPEPREVQANCSNEVSHASLSVNISIYEPATGCFVKCGLQVATTNTTVQYLTSVSNGSHVELVIQFGDGSIASTYIDRVNNITELHVFEHVYNQAGLYTVQLKASNPVSYCYAYSDPVIIQVPILADGFNLQIIPSAVDVLNQTSVFTITLKEDAPMPTNVTAYWTFGDGNSSTVSVPTGRTMWNTSHTYQETGIYEISVHLINMVSELNLYGALAVVEQIQDIDYNISAVAAAVGANLTLSILAASGSSISYTIDFGDGSVDTRFQDNPDFLQFVHSYDQVGMYILTIRAENGLSWIIFKQTEITVGYPVRGLNFEASSEVLYSPGNITFSLTIDNEVPPPTAMECIWRRASGYEVEELMRVQNVTIAPGNSLNVTHHFPGGDFLVSLKCKNVLGDLTLKKEITVYEAIADLEITSNDVIAEVGSQVQATVSTAKGSLLNYVVQFGEGQTEHRYISMSTHTKIQMFYCVYTTPGLYIPSVVAGNVLGESNATLDHSIEVLYSTHGLQLSSDSPMTFPKTLVAFTLAPLQGVVAPSTVRLSWNFGDGTVKYEMIDFNMTHGTTRTHNYDAPETYQTTVTVANNLDSNTYNTTVVINAEAAEGIRVSFQYHADGIWRTGLGPDFNWFLAGSRIKMSANATYDDATILWDFGNEETSSLEVVYKRYDAPSVYNITVKVLSNTDVLAELQYIFYIVKPFDISSIQAVDETGLSVLKSGKQVDFKLLGNGFDSPLCVSWDAGDLSQDIVYGPDPCQMMSRSNGIFIQSSHEVGVRFSHTYTSPGYYRVNVSGSNFYSTDYRWKEVMVIGCWSPPAVAIRGPGETSDAPRSHRTSEAILLDADISLDCLGIRSTTFTWEVYQLLTDDTRNITERLAYNISSVSGPKLDLTPGSLEVGLYEIVISVTVDEFENATSIDRVYISIEHSPLVLVLVGGSSRAVGNVHPLVLDAMTSSYDPDNNEDSPSDWSFKWSCQKLSDNGENRSTSTNSMFPSTTYLCDNSSWKILNFTDALIQLDPTQLRVGEVYSFKVEAAVESRLASYEQTVMVMQGQPPELSIRCVSNCRGKTNPTSSFTLQGSCDNCNTPGESLFTWSLSVKQQTNGEFQIVRNLGDMTSTGVAKQGIAFNPNQLDAGREYQLRLDVRNDLLGNGFTQYSFMTNLPPYNGSCQITPTIGYAITTEFSVNCTGWLDEGHAVDRASISDQLTNVQVLHYRVMSRPKGQMSYSLKTSSTDNLISGMIFELGLEESGYAHEVQIGVVDVYGATAYVDLVVTVEKPSLTADDIMTLISSNDSSLSLLVLSGNIEGATQLMSAVLSVLPDQQDGNSSMTTEDLTELYSDLVLKLGSISLWAKTADSLFQASSIMAQTLTRGVNNKALVHAASTMARMAQSLEGLDTDNPQVIIDTADGLTGGLGSLIAQSDGIVQNAMKTCDALMYTTDPLPAVTDEPVAFDVYGDDLSPEEIAQQAAQEEEEREKIEEIARLVAMTISMLARGTLDLVSGVVMGQRVSGQPPVTLVTDKLTLEVYKDEPNSVVQRVISANTGSFQLPNASSLFGGNGVTQVEQTIYAYNSNPYSFSKSSNNIGSKGVLSLEFKSGQGEPLSVKNLTDNISIILEVDKSKLESAEDVKMTFKNASSISYQKVELNEENAELRVNFKEISDNLTHFLVYLRKGAHPNGSVYDAFTEIPRVLRKDEKWNDEGLVMEATYTAVFPTESLTGVGDYYLGISIATPSSVASNQTSGLDGVNVTLVTYVTGCRYWNANSTAWSSEGCQVGPQTTSRSTHCLCNHLTSFAASFFVPPNTIDFSTVFSKFRDLGDNAAVFATVLGFFGLYLILLVWLRRKDKQDIVKWGVSPLADSRSSDDYFYQVTVQTGMGPGCGTRSKVSIVLTGEDGDSGVRLLDDHKRKVFERGSICHFLMGVAMPLGPLAYLKIWHDNSGSGQLGSWYLSQVSIIDLQNGQQFFFVCDRWFAVEKDDGVVERVVPVATRTDLTRFSKLFYSSSRRNLFDEHIWFSLFSRPTRSNFTRVQRLSCCLCLLYLSMIANAMFYRTEETVENPTALRLGPFIFTLQQVFIGFISALVVVPVNLVIVQVFRKSKPNKSELSTLLPKHLQDNLDDLKDGVSESSTPQSSIADFKSDKVELIPLPTPPRGKAKDKEAKARPFLLPHWCIYVAWLLMFLSSFTAAFFTVLYSLEWGQEKSSEWLTSMLVSLFNSVIIIQPFKVVALAIIVSLVFKKPSKMDVEIDGEFSGDQNRLKNDEELLHYPNSSDQASSKCSFRPPPSKAALEEARKKRLKEIKMTSILREMGIYSIFVALVLFLCYSNRDGMSFYMSQSLRNIFVVNNGAENTSTKLTFASLEKSTPDLFWEWVETALIPGLYGDVYYNGDPMHWRHTRFVSDWQGYRVGPVRLRQLRVKNDPCQIVPDISILQPRCHLDYSWSNQDESNFTVAWQPQNAHISRLYSDTENAPWVYHDYLELNGVPHPGILAVYSGGGYVAEFGTTTSKALSTTQFLKEMGWYDELTRAIFVEFSVYNANVNLFSVATLLAETPTTGGAIVTSNIHTLRLYHYEGTLAIFTVIFQVTFVAYLLFFLVKLILAVKRGGLKKLMNFWTAIELVMLMIAIAAIVMFAFRQVFIELALQEVKNKDQGAFVNFSHIAKWDEFFGYLMACVAFLSLIRYMRLLRLNPRMSVLGMTLGYASKDIFHFVIMWNLVFLAFGQLAYFLFHSVVKTFSSFVSTLETLFSMLLGKFDFEAMVEANRILGGVVFLMYIVTMYMILTNMFITIVVEAFTQMRNKNDLDDAVDAEMVGYIMERFKTFFLRPLQGGAGSIPQAKAELASYNDTLESLEQRVDKIVSFVEASYGTLDISTNQKEPTDSPARSLSRVSLHSAANSSTGSYGSPKKTCNRVILIA